MQINIKDLHYKIPNGAVVYEKLNLKLYRGDFFGVLGKNGAGKTTLIDLIMGFRAKTSGDISVLGEDPMSSNRVNKNKIFVLSHDIQIQSSHSVRNYLDFTSFFYPKYSKEREAALLDILKIRSSDRFGSMSTGQKAKAQIVAALASGSELILIDEITAVLDPESRKAFFLLLKELKNNSHTSIILATNIIEDIREVFDKVLFIDGNKTDLYEVEDLEKLFSLDDVEVSA